jgi:PAS domain S-box-containing protein
MIEHAQDLPLAVNPSECFISDFFRDVAEAVFIMDLNGLILNAEGSFTKDFAPDPEKCLDADGHNRLSPDAHRCLTQNVAKLKLMADEVRNTGKTVNFEIIHDNITRILTIFPIRPIQGAITHFLLAVQNGNRKNPPETEGSKNLAAIKALYDTIAASVIIVDSSMHLIGWNRFSRDTINGLSDEKMAGVNPFDRVHPDDVSDLSDRLFSNIINRDTEETAEFRMFHKNGPPYKWARVRAKRAVIEGQPCMVAVVTEITELKQAEEQQKILQAQLLQYQKMELIGELAGSIAHDFNNALTAIIGNTAHILGRLDHASPFIDNISDIHTLATRSANLTRQLLAFARKQVASPKSIDLNEFISDFLSLQRRLIGSHIQLEWHPCENQAVVLFDPTQLDQIFSNLLINARDSIKESGKILIECDFAHYGLADFPVSLSGHAPGDYIKLSLSDTGCGIDEKVLPHIYEPFFTTKAVGKGTGLGLSTVYGILAQNNGFIECRTETGKGTTFDIFLPWHGRPGHEKESVAKAPAIPNARQTILVVEDEPYILKVIKDILESCRFTVLTTRDAEECMHINRTCSPRIDLVITDVVLPTMNGVQLSVLLQRDNPTLRVLFLSAHAPENISHEKQFEEGVNIIRKPFGINDFIKAVNRVLGNS